MSGLIRDRTLKLSCELRFRDLDFRHLGLVQGSAIRDRSSLRYIVAGPKISIQWAAIHWNDENKS